MVLNQVKKDTYELYKKNRKRTVTGSFPKIIYAKDMKETTEYEEYTNRIKITIKWNNTEEDLKSINEASHHMDGD